VSQSRSDIRREKRLEAIADLRQKLHRSAVAMSFLPSAELSRHMGLASTVTAEKLLGDTRLTQRIYWQLVDDERAPDIAAIPAHSGLKIIDSVTDFENACECVDATLALRERGIMIGKEQIKELARRFGDARLKWAWDNRDIWVDAASRNPDGTSQVTASKDAAVQDERSLSAPQQRKANARRMLLDHLAITMPDIAAWMGRSAVSQQRKASMTPEMQVVGRVVERIVNPARQARNG
jgi:hypothetical protein